MSNAGGMSATAIARLMASARVVAILGHSKVLALSDGNVVHFDHLQCLLDFGRRWRESRHGRAATNGTSAAHLLSEMSANGDARANSTEAGAIVTERQEGRNPNDFDRCGRDRSSVVSGLGDAFWSNARSYRFYEVQQWLGPTVGVMGHVEPPRRRREVLASIRALSEGTHFSQSWHHGDQLIATLA